MVWSHFFSFRKMGGMAKYLWEPLFLKSEVSWSSKLKRSKRTPLLHYIHIRYYDFINIISDQASVGLFE